MARIHVPNFTSPVQARGTSVNIQMPGSRGDPTATGRIAERSIATYDQFGRSMQQLGAVGVGIAADMQREVNRTRVMSGQREAQNYMRDLRLGAGDDPGYQSLKGQAAVIAGDNGESAADGYRNRLGTRLDEIAKGFSNDAQRNAFAVWRETAENEFNGQLQNHQMREFRAFQRSEEEGAIQVGINNAMADWRSDEAVRNAIDGRLVPGSDTERYGGVRDSAERLAKLQGKSAVETAYDVRKAVSTAHMGVLSGALASGDSTRALEYLSSNKADMLANDVLKANGEVQSFVDAAQAQAAVAGATQGMSSTLQPTDMDRLQGVVAEIESGTRDYYSDGRTVVSPAGAKYTMQVMPATAKDPGYGIRPAASDSPEEYNRVGRELLSALVKKYGNVGQALAAYNGGAKHVDLAIKDATKAGDPTAWVGELRKYKSEAAYKENSEYVRKGLAKFGAGGGAPQQPTEQAFVAGAVALLGPNPSAQAVQMTQKAAAQQYGSIQRSIKARDDQAVADAMRELQTNGGRVDSLPSALRARIPPKELDNLYSYAERIYKGDDHTDEMLYARLSANPQALADMSDDQFLTLNRGLSRSDFKHFANERAKALGKTSESGGDKSGDLNSTAIKGGLDQRLRVLGVDPTPTDNGKKDAARVGAIRQYVDQYFYAAQREAGKKFSDAEVNAHLDALFAKNQTVKGIFSDSSQPLMTIKVGDIPRADRDNLRTAMRNAGVSDPTDAQLLGAYWNLKTMRDKAKQGQQ